MSSLKDLKHDIANKLICYTPADSKRRSKQENHAKRYLKDIEDSFLSTIKEYNLPNFPFTHVLKDMGVVIDYGNVDHSLRHTQRTYNHSLCSGLL